MEGKEERVAVAGQNFELNSLNILIVFFLLFSSIFIIVLILIRENNELVIQMPQLKF